jgi:nanoRNase/pAp phosphatase (c-di-AMP/oligoRNAs hydrolase)
VAHFRAALDAARAGASDTSVLVLTHRGPDPDAIGACEGMRFLCSEVLGFEARVATVGRIHRAENLVMVRALDLDFATYDEIDAGGFFGSVLVDTQPEFGHTLLPRDIPVLAVFDHHVPPGDGAQAQGLEVAHRDVRLGTGATSSIVYEYLRDSGVELPERVATALFCGVRYDTADLSRNASALDEEAYHATFRLADRALVTAIDHPPLPPIYYTELSRALTVARQHDALALALLGEISHPEFAAEMADFFLRMKGCSWVVVGGAVAAEKEYVLSLRTDRHFGNAYPLMDRVLDGEGSFGGHGHIAGARIPMEDTGESFISSIERRLRHNALAVLGKNEAGELPSEGRPLG